MISYLNVILIIILLISKMSSSFIFINLMEGILVCWIL